LLHLWLRQTLHQRQQWLLRRRAPLTMMILPTLRLRGALPPRQRLRRKLHRPRLRRPLLHRWLCQTLQCHWRSRSQLHHLLLSPRATTLLVLRQRRAQQRRVPRSRP